MAKFYRDKTQILNNHHYFFKNPSSETLKLEPRMKRKPKPTKKVATIKFSLEPVNVIWRTRRFRQKKISQVELVRIKLDIGENETETKQEETIKEKR